jgi:transposase
MAGSGGPGRTGPGAHEQWIAAQRFSEPALDAALAHYRAALDTRQAELAPWASREPLAAAVARLGCYRGIAELTGLVLAAEVVNWRRFPSARAFMCFTGLVPAGCSSGERTRSGSITKAGSGPTRTALIEAAWSYRFRPAIGVTLRRRQRDADPQTLARSWRAQRRLHARYKAMTARGKPAAVAVTAMARELAGFVWAEMTS